MYYASPKGSYTLLVFRHLQIRTILMLMLKTELRMKINCLLPGTTFGVWIYSNVVYPEFLFPKVYNISSTSIYV